MSTMLHLFQKNLLLPYCRSASSSHVRKLLTRFQVCGFSSSSSSLSQAHSRGIDVFVWWNVDDCEMPSGVSLLKVPTSITAAVRANGIMGNIHISAFGDFYSPKKADIKTLFLTGITLRPNSAGKNLAYNSLLADLNVWVSANPPPAHLFLISGYGDFSGILQQYRMRNYNILLACPERAHVALCHAATIIWEWSSMLKGEDLIGKHFNYPPDGPFNSWYGNSNVPLENPFSAVEQAISSQNAEIYEPSSDMMLDKASKSVSTQVMKILSSHPNGISMGDLRAELTKCDLPLGKCFYGHKKFSNFLVSIPHVQLQYFGKGNFWVCLVPSTTSAFKENLEDRSAHGIPRISSLYVSSKGDDSKSFQSIPSERKLIGEYVDGKSSFPSFKESNVHQNQPLDEFQKTSLGSEEVVDVARALLPKFQLPPNDNDISKKYDNDLVSSEDVILEQDGGHPPQPHWDNIGVSVWWDFDGCGVPSGISFLNVAPSIMGVVRANRIKGPIHIDAYGDVSQLSKIKQEALFLSGIDLHHIPGGKIRKYKCFRDWVSQNRPPAHLFLICGDRDWDIYGFVHLLGGLCNYNILLACPGHNPLCSAATIMWHWSSILKGKYLSGKYFGHPPDWYIKMRVPLEYPPEWYRNSKLPDENPFSAAEEPTSSQNVEIHEPSSYIKLAEVPKSISWGVRKILSTRQVTKILSSYPNGISIGDLCLQLRLSNYLRKGFSNILVSIPHVQLVYIGEDNFCVRLIPSSASTIKNKQRDVNHSGMQVLFSTASFWDDMESFVFTCRGSRLLSRSRSREELAHKLQKHGPMFLMTLTENEILPLVELIISEKKWLVESPSQEFPFRLTRSIRKSSLMESS